MITRTAALLAFLTSLGPTAASAVVITYTDESAYLAQLGALGLEHWSENFEGAAWDGVRTTVDVNGHRDYHVAASVTNQGITWQGPSYMSPLSTSPRFHLLPGEDSAGWAANKWGLVAVTRRSEVDAFKGTSASTLYGIGGWFDTLSGYKYDEDSSSYIPAGHMFVGLNGSLAANDFGAGGDTDPSKLINAIAYNTPPRFFGIIDTDGFNSFNFFSDQLTVTETGGFPGESSEPGFYAPIVYADNFTFAAAQAISEPVPGPAPEPASVPEPSTWASMVTGLVLLLGMRRNRRTKLPTDGVQVKVELVPQGQ
ncbi:MAG: PEP-CTERM sorting domain-containing protein [Thiobacillus sp.]